MAKAETENLLIAEIYVNSPKSGSLTLSLRGNQPLTEEMIRQITSTAADLTQIAQAKTPKMRKLLMKTPLAEITDDQPHPLLNLRKLGR